MKGLGYAECLCVCGWRRGCEFLYRMITEAKEKMSSEQKSEHDGKPKKIEEQSIPYTGNRKQEVLNFEAEVFLLYSRMNQEV